MKLGYRAVPPKPPPNDPIEAAKALLAEGLSVQKVASKLHMTDHVVGRIQREMQATATVLERQREGLQPLPIGHRITWGAISKERCPLELLNGK